MLSLTAAKLLLVDAFGHLVELFFSLAQPAEVFALAQVSN